MTRFWFATVAAAALASQGQAEPAQAQDTPATQQPAPSATAPPEPDMLGAPATPDLAMRDRLGEQAQQFAAQGKLAEAAVAGEAMLAIERELLSADHPDIVGSLEWLGAIYERAHDWPKAHDRRAAALAWRQQYQASGHWLTVDARLALEHVDLLSQLSDDEHAELAEAARLDGRLLELFQKGDYASALELAQQSLEVHRRVLGEEHRDCANFLNIAGLLCRVRGDHARAESLYRQALEIRQRVLGENHPDTASSLDSLGSLYYLTGHFAQAQPLLQQALEIRRRVLGENHLDYAASLNNLALLYRTIGDYARAEPLYQQDLEITKRLLGEEHSHYATTLNNLGVLYQALGDYARAEPPYRQALEINQRVLGENHPHYATSLDNLAGLYGAMGDYERAESLYRQALEIRQRVLGEHHPDSAASLSNLGAFYREMGDYARAEPLLLQALGITQRVLGENHPDYAARMSSLGVLYHYLGDSARAEPLFLNALEVRRRVLGENHPDCALSLNNLGALYKEMGDYVRAEPLYRKALEIRQRVLGLNHPDYAASLNNLGMLYEAMGDFARAAPLLQQTLEIRQRALGENHPDYAASLNNLGMLYDERGDYARAEPLYQQASEIWKRTLGEDHPNYATSLNNLAELHRATGDHARAEQLLQQALAIRKRALGENHPDYADSLSNLGLLNYALGDIVRAEACFQQALEIRQRVLGESHPRYAVSLSSLSGLYLAQSNFTTAAPLFAQAFGITARHVDATALILSEQQQLAHAQSLAGYLDSYLSCLSQLEGRASEAFRAVLGWKGATLVRQRAARLVADEPELAPLFQQLQSVTARWAHLATAIPTDADQAARFSEQRIALEAEKQRLEAELARRSAVFRQATAEVTLEDLLAALPADAALVDYLETTHFWPDESLAGGLARERRLRAFVVRPDRPVQMFDLGEVASIGQAIDTWRVSFGMSPRGQQAGRLLRERLWQPLIASLEGAETVLVSPDGALGRLPLAALPGREPGSYLIEDHRLALVPVPQLIPALVNDAGRRELEKDLLLLGDADYDHRAAPPAPDESTRPGASGSRGPSTRAITAALRWNPLPGAASEVAFVRDLYSRLDSGSAEAIVDLRGPSATEEAFRREAPRCQLLHLATHGYFAQPDRPSALSAEAVAAASDAARSGRANLLGERHDAVRGFSPGLLSGLVFAGANTPPEWPDDASQLDRLPDDGYLTADELAFLPLDGVRLVVLSACETGLGEVAGGEGLLGIQRAFQVAGASSTIATLWKVDDAATREIMQRFYTSRLEAGLGMLDALRETQLWALRTRLGGRGIPGVRGADDPNLPPAANGPSSDAPSSDGPSSDGQSLRLSPEFWAAFVLSGNWR